MATPELIPLEILFGNPDKFSPRISPDGRRLAYIAPHEGVLNVWLGAIGSDDFKPITDDRDRGIRSFNWCHDNRTILYTQDQGGDENFRIYSVNTDGGPVVDRTPFEGVQAQLLALSKERPDQVVIGINKDNEQLHDAYVLTLSTGNLEKVAENPGFIQWAIDHQLNVRGRTAPSGRRRLRLPDRRQARARSRYGRRVVDRHHRVHQGWGRAVREDVGRGQRRAPLRARPGVGRADGHRRGPEVRRRHRRAAPRDA